MNTYERAAVKIISFEGYIREINPGVQAWRIEASLYLGINPGVQAWRIEASFS